MVRKSGKSSASCPTLSWRSFFCSARDEPESVLRTQIRRTAGQIETIFRIHASSQLTSHKLVSSLSLPELSSSLAALDASAPEAPKILASIAYVIQLSHVRLAAALVEHGFVEAVVKVHERAVKADKPVSRACVLVLHTLVLRYSVCSYQEGVRGSFGISTVQEEQAAAVIAHMGHAADRLALKPELVNLLLTHLVYAAVRCAAGSPLDAPALGTALRCVQLAWDLVRSPTPGAKALQEFFNKVGLPARLLTLAAAAKKSVDASSAQKNVATASSSSSAIPSSSSPSRTLLLQLACTASTFAVSLLKLLAEELDVSAAGLAEQRKWLLTSSNLAALREPLTLLCEELGSFFTEDTGRTNQNGDALEKEVAAEGAEADEVAMPFDPESCFGRLTVFSVSVLENEDDEELERKEEEAQGEGVLAKEGGARDFSTSATTAVVGAEERLKKQLRAAVPSAIRNILVFLGLPTIVRGDSAPDISTGVSFMIRFLHALLMEGYLDILRLLAALPLPQQPVSGADLAGDRAGQVVGYQLFFKAYGLMMEQAVLSTGLKLTEWGATFSDPGSAVDATPGVLPMLLVGEGVDASTTRTWIQEQIPLILDRGNKMLHVLDLASTPFLGPRADESESEPSSASDGSAADKPAEEDKSATTSEAGKKEAGAADALSSAAAAAILGQRVAGGVEIEASGLIEALNLKSIK